MSTPLPHPTPTKLPPVIPKKAGWFAVNKMKGFIVSITVITTLWGCIWLMVDAQKGSAETNVSQVVFHPNGGVGALAKEIKGLDSEFVMNELIFQKRPAMTDTTIHQIPRMVDNDILTAARLAFEYDLTALQIFKLAGLHRWILHDSDYFKENALEDFGTLEENIRKELLQKTIESLSFDSVMKVLKVNADVLQKGGNYSDSKAEIDGWIAKMKSDKAELVAGAETAKEDNGMSPVEYRASSAFRDKAYLLVLMSVQTDIIRSFNLMLGGASIARSLMGPVQLEEGMAEGGIDSSESGKRADQIVRKGKHSSGFLKGLSGD